MNCITAQQVWGHPKGFLEGLKKTCPGVLERIGETINGLVQGLSNPFHESVKRKVGNDVATKFYVTHADDNDPVAEQVHDVIGDAAAKMELEQHFSHMHGQEIVLGNLCCSGCDASFGKHSRNELLAIQNAAVRTDEDGSDILL